MLGAYIDDSCMGGYNRFEDLTTATLDNFESEPWMYHEFTFFGASVCRLAGPPRLFTLNQTAYIDALSRLRL